jgi:hypothetical protein
MATFNARAETVETNPFFRDAFKRTRCLIPVSGYCEWQDTPTGKQPWYFTARDGSPTLTTAGLWDEWRDSASGEALKSCTMIITEPKAFVAEVHDRMPVLLAEKDFEPWLSGSAGLELLKPAANDLLQRWPVSKRVNGSLVRDRPCRGSAVCALQDFELAGWCSLSLGGAAPSAAPDQARALDRGAGAADSFLVLSGGGRRGRAMGSASPTAGLQQHGDGGA